MSPGAAGVRLSSPIPDPRPKALTWRRPEPAYAGMTPLPLDATEHSAGPSAFAQTVEPELDQFVFVLLRAFVDTIAGRRQAAQLTRWVEAEVYAELVLRARLYQRDPVPLAVRSYRVQRVAEHAVEVAARLQEGSRHTAMALRLDRRGTRWVCRIADFGPSHGSRGTSLPGLRTGRTARTAPVPRRL